LGIAIASGERIPLHLTLESRDTAKYVRATIRDNAGVEEIGSPVDIAHLAAGSYFDDSFFMPNKPNIIVRYEVYDDALYTTVSQENLPTDERIQRDDLDSIVGDLGDLIDNLNTTALRPDLVAFLSEGAEIVGIVEDTEEIGVIEDTGLVGSLDEETTLTGQSTETELIGTIKDCD